MKSKEKTVLSTENSKTTKEDIPKQSRKLNSSSTAKKCVKKEPNEKTLFSLNIKSPEDFNDSSDFISPQNRRKRLKSERSTSKEPKKRTSQKSLSRSSPDRASSSKTSTGRRTRSSERKSQETERNGESITDNSDLPKSSPTSTSISGSVVKGNSASKPSRSNSQESKKQNHQTPKLSKVKTEPPEKDENLKPSKKLAKLEQVKSGVKSLTDKEGAAPVVGKDKPPTKRRTSRPKSKSSDTSNPSVSEKDDSSQMLLTAAAKTSTPVVGKDKPPTKRRTSRPKSKSSDTTNPSVSEKDDSPKMLLTAAAKTSTPVVGKDKPPTKRRTSRPKSKSSDTSNPSVSEKDDSPQMLLTAAAKMSTPNRRSSKGGKESNSNSPVNANQNGTAKCPTCNLIPEEGLSWHILMCLKNKYAAGQPPALSNRDQLLKDEILAHQIHEDMNKDALVSKESVSTEEIDFCTVCQKDLRHMNSMWKTKHINQCFDDADKNAPKKKKSAATVRRQVPACPMCGKEFKTGTMRKCHLKKCAQELSVSPEKALKLIAEQRKNFKPPQPETAVAGSSSKPARSLSNKSKKVPDEQMQMAMAISSSLFEEQQKLNEHLTETVKNIHQGVNRELRKLKKSKKKAPESTPLLLTISKEEQLARNAQRVEAIINQPIPRVHFSRPFPRSTLHLRRSDVYQKSENPLPSLWSRASLTDSSLFPNSFYIPSLPPDQVDKVTVGSRLKPLSAIPGRELDKEEIPSVSDNQPDTSSVPLSQTAFLLAELAQSNEEDLNDEESDEGSTIEQTQGFFLSPEIDDTAGTHENTALNELVEDLCNLVNNPHLSDVEFVAADSSRVFAHRLLLSARCPQILCQAVSRENCMVIEIKDVSHNSLLAFLRYVYAGRVDFDKNVAADLLQLSRKFNLLHLASICEEMLPALIDEACDMPSVESIAGDVPESLEIGDNDLQENDDDGMTVDDDSAEPYKVDILAGFEESPSKKLCSLSGTSPLKSSPHLQENDDDDDDGMTVDDDSTEPYKVDILAGIEEPQSKKLCSLPRTSPLKSSHHLQENDDDDDGMTVDDDSAEPFKVDILAGIEEPQSKKLCSLPGTSPLKSSHGTALHFSAECSDQEEPSDVKFSPKKRNETVFSELKDEEFTALDSSDAESDKTPTSFRGSAEHLDGRSDDDGSPSVSCLSPDPGFTDVHSGTVSREDKKHSNNALSPMHCQEEEDELYKENSMNPTSVSCAMSDYGFDDSNELFSESEDVQEESGNINVSEVNSKKLKTKELIDDFMETSNDSICFLSENQMNIHVTGMSTTALHLADTVCENTSSMALHLADTVCENTSSMALDLANIVCENTSSTALHLADTVCENTSSTALHLADTVCENTSSMAFHLADTVCENTSSMAFHLADTVCENTSSTALHLADTVCENTSSMAFHLADTVCENTSSTALHLADAVLKKSAHGNLVSVGAPIKRMSPASPPQVLHSNSPASFHMADTILELSKTDRSKKKDSSDSLCMTGGSPLSVTVLEGLMKTPTRTQGSVSKSCTVSSKNLKKFSPCCLSERFDSADQNFWTDSDSELEVKESPTKLSTSPKFSFLANCKSSPVVKNSLSPHEDLSDVISHSWERRKRKSCNEEELLPLSKRARQKRPNLHESEVSEFCSFKAKSSVAIDSPSDLVSTDSYLPSESTLITLDLKKDSPKKPLFKNQRKNVEEWLEIPDGNSHCDISLPNSPDIVLDRNLDTFSRLSDDDSLSEDKSDRYTKAGVSLEPDSDLEMEPDSKNGASFHVNFKRNQDCLPGSSRPKSPDLPPKKFKFKKTQLKNQDRNSRCMEASVSLEQDSDSEVEPDFTNSASLDVYSERYPDCLPRSSRSKTPDLPKKKFTFKRTQLKNLKSPVVCASVCSSSPSAGHTSPKRDPSLPKYSSHLGSSSEDQDSLNDRVESDTEYHQPDVWDDFEDNGHMEEFVVFSSPAQQNASPAEHIGVKELDCKDNSDSDSPRTPEVGDEIANNESFNSSFINDFMCSSSPVMSPMEDSPHLGHLQPSPYPSLSVVDVQGGSNKASPITPLIAIKKRFRKELTIPSPFTPMPLYTQMTTPDLKKEMKKNGCKQMTRKKMVTLLQEIYQKTHEYETDSDLDHSILSPKIQPVDRDIVGLQTRNKDCFLRTHKEKISPVAVKITSRKDKSAAKGSADFAEMPSSQSEFTNLVESGPHESDAVGAYEESFMANEEDIPSSQQQMSGSSDNLHDRLRELVQKCPDIYSKILLYEPIDFNQLKMRISESKIKCSAAKLLSFLDNQCITFAMKKEKQPHRTWKPRVPRR